MKDFRKFLKEFFSAILTGLSTQIKNGFRHFGSDILEEANQNTVNFYTPQPISAASTIGLASFRTRSVLTG